jgi:hypothetical protein
VQQSIVIKAACRQENGSVSILPSSCYGYISVSSIEVLQNFTLAASPVGRGRRGCNHGDGKLSTEQKDLQPKTHLHRIRYAVQSI